MSNDVLNEQVLPLAIARHAELQTEKIFRREMNGKSLSFAQTQREALRWARVLREAEVEASDPRSARQRERAGS